VSQVRNFGHAKLALGKLGIKLMVTKALQHHFEVLQVLFGALTKHTDIIQVNEHELA
jgi:hypothetical protein